MTGRRGFLGTIIGGIAGLCVGKVALAAKPDVASGDVPVYDDDGVWIDGTGQRWCVYETWEFGSDGAPTTHRKMLVKFTPCIADVVVASHDGSGSGSGGIEHVTYAKLLTT